MVYLLNRRKAFREVVTDYKAFYQFEQNGNDETGNYNATMSNVTYAKNQGIINYYAIFNGSTSGGSINSEIIANSNSTICGWIYVDSTGSGERIIYAEAISTGGAEFIINIEADGRLRYGIFKDTAAWEFVFSNAAISTDVWVHYCVQRNKSTGLMTIDIDNVQQTDTGTYTGNTNATITDSYIGFTNFGGGTGYFDGREDNLRIYDRVLTSDEKTAIYNFEK